MRKKYIVNLNNPPRHENIFVDLDMFRKCSNTPRYRQAVFISTKLKLQFEQRHYALHKRIFIDKINLLAKHESERILHIQVLDSISFGSIQFLSMNLQRWIITDAIHSSTERCCVIGLQIIVSSCCCRASNSHCDDVSFIEELIRFKLGPAEQGRHVSIFQCDRFEISVFNDTLSPEINGTTMTAKIWNRKIELFTLLEIRRVSEKFIRNLILIVLFSNEHTFSQPWSVVSRSVAVHPGW